MANWNSYLTLLKAYYNLHQHSNVPRRVRRRKELSEWVSIQRLLHHHDRLSDDKRQQLDQYDFEYDCDPSEFHHLNQFVKRCIQLKTYFEENGHTEIPLRCDIPRGLGTWCQKQRQHERNGTLKGPRKSLINEFSSDTFKWGCHNGKDTWQKIWANHYKTVKTFFLQHGHTRLPDSEEYQPLKNWLTRQRFAMGQNELDETRASQLNAIGVRERQNGKRDAV